MTMDLVTILEEVSRRTMKVDINKEIMTADLHETLKVLTKEIVIVIIILNSQESLEITSQMIQTTSDNHVKTGKTHGEMSLLRKITPTISIQIDKTIIVRIISDVMMIVKATISPARTILKTGSRAVDFLNESRGKTTMSNEETSTKDKTTFDHHAKTIRTVTILAGERIKTTTMNRETILALSSSILQIL